ncbi:pyridoxamine 5'-phosphate oxidase family protein [Microbacterium sp.]|uniref:pyridoxamine 5'-phosphate oxidase family protein n=1 Tax=Microbacterium sp. TaxID=51671 RepID=UPI0037C7F781
MGISLDARERAAMLGTHGEAVLATTDRTGTAVPLPVWYVMADGAPHVRTPRSSKRVGHISRNPRVSLLVHGGKAWRELRGILLRARATIIDEEPEVARISDILDERFADLLPPPLPGAVARRYAETVILRLDAIGEPMSWDNRKLRL